MREPALSHEIPLFMKTFAENRQPPEKFSYTTASNDWEKYGWDVRLDRPVLEFSTFSEADDEGFKLSGSGPARVVTPAYYKPGKVRMINTTTAEGTTKKCRWSGPKGRIAVQVPLGPANPTQQCSPEAKVASTKVFENTVTIAPVTKFKTITGNRGKKRKKPVCPK